MDDRSVTHSGGQADAHAPTGSVQIHLRLGQHDAQMLRRFAAERCQTPSGFVRHLLRRHAEVLARNQQAGAFVLLVLGQW